MSQGQELYTVLNHETVCLQQLLDVLEQEHKALLAADVDSIEQATAIKNAALAAQAQASQSRQHLVSQSACDNSEEGLRQLIARCDNVEQLGDTFFRLNTLAQQCQAMNRSNGRLIMQRQEQARGALNVIRQTSGATPTYSGQGKTMATQATRSLGKA